MDGQHFDVIVVGGNFAGLSAAMQLARARHTVLVFDDGKPRNRFAAASHGFFGQDGRAPLAIMAEASRQLLAYPSVTKRGERAVVARKDGEHFVIETEGGTAVRGARVILATGVRDILPEMDGLAERWGRSVLHCPYCHGYEIGPKPLGVLATGKHSIHQAMAVSQWGALTYFTQGKFTPDAEQRAMLAGYGVMIEESPIVQLLGASPALDGVRLADGREIALAALFTASRIEMTSPLAAQLGCAMEDGPQGPIIRVDDFKQTSVQHVFAAGDVSAPMSNAMFSAAAGTMAGLAAHRSLFMK